MRSVRSNGDQAKNGKTMSADELRKCIVASPFRAFTLNIADGRRIPVLGRDFVLMAPEKGRTVVVYQRNDDFDILDTMSITGLSFESAASNSPSS
jgi:hypothetical protein